MNTSYLLPLSFFVALMVVLGGAPVLSRFARLVGASRIAPDQAVGAGGAVIVLALLLDSFYLLPLPDNAGGLLLALLIALAVNALLWLRLADEQATRWRHALGVPLLAALMLWVIGLPDTLVFDSALVVKGWFGAVLTFAFAATLVLSPLALASIGDGITGRHRAGSPYLILPTMLGILTLTLNAAFAGLPGVAALDAVLHVFLPTLGAIAGIVFYSMRMPWRRNVLVSMGASGQLVVAMIAGWGAIQLAAAAPHPATAMASLLWMMMPPLFEVGRELIRQRAVTELDETHIDGRLLSWLRRPATSATVHIMATFMVVVGLCVFWIPEFRVWKSGVALPIVFLLYLLLGGWACAADQHPVAARKLKARNS